MLCPSCKKAVFRLLDNELKVRTPILVIRKDHAEIPCPHCKAPVKLDITFNAAKALDAAGHPR